MPATQQDILQRVSDVLVESLSVEEAEIRPDASLKLDLDAESIDMLDIAFHLEKEFDIKMQGGDLYPEGILANPAFIQNGRVTDVGMKELRSAVPYLNLEAFDRIRSVEQFGDFITVDTIVRFITAKLA